MVVLAFAMVLYSNAMVKNMERRQVENDDDPFAELQDDNEGDEELNTARRKSSQCEPCGLMRTPCCFPNLCQHRTHQISKCLGV